MGPQEKKPINWRVWITAILIALVVVVCLQNSQQVSVEVLFASFNAPLIVMLLVFAGLGALIGYIAPLVLRHRKAAKVQSPVIEAQKKK